MRKFLSIVIPRFRESEADIFPLLSSINTQAGVDFDDLEVIIVNDGGGPGELHSDFLGLFTPNIRQISLPENKGPGVARQAGLDAAKGEYVLFCDADDVLHSVGVLGALMQEIKRDFPDILTSSWLEELAHPDGSFSYKEHKQENTWMHGKLFRRAFLSRWNIRFHPELRVHEDSYFLCIAAAATQNIRYMPFTSYVWKSRPDSITRRDGAIYTYESLPTFIHACSMAHREVEKINPNQMEYKILQFTLYNYFCFHQPGWLDPERKDFLQAAEDSFAAEIKPFWHYWKNASPQNVAQVYNQERAKNFPNGIESETIFEWINRLKLE